MAKVRIEFSDAAVRQLLTSADVDAVLKATADRIQTAAGDGFVSGVDHGTQRSRGYVVTENQHGQRAEAKDRRLTRALDAGRG